MRCPFLAKVSIFKKRLNKLVQAQTLPHATPPIGKIHPVGKIAVSFLSNDAFVMPFEI